MIKYLSELIEMKIHAMMTVPLDNNRNEYRILRVHGGWLYERWYNDTAEANSVRQEWLWKLFDTTFVPWPQAPELKNEKAAF